MASNRRPCPYCPKLFHPSSYQRHVVFCSRQHFLQQKKAALQSRKRYQKPLDDDPEPETSEEEDDLPEDGIEEAEEGEEEEEEEEEESEVEEVHDF